MRRYHAIAGACWLAVFASLKLVDAPGGESGGRVGDATLIWALNTGCLAFFAAVIHVETITL